VKGTPVPFPRIPRPHCRTASTDYDISAVVHFHALRVLPLPSPSSPDTLLPSCLQSRQRSWRVSVSADCPIWTRHLKVSSRHALQSCWLLPSRPLARHLSHRQ